MKYIRKRLKKTNGFSLVELLVIVTIIGILVALSIPVVGKMSKKSKEAECMHRLRQSTMALLLSTGDNDGRLRLFSTGSGNFEYRPKAVVAQYLGIEDEDGTGLSNEIMSCPSIPEDKTGTWDTYGVNFTTSEIAGAQWTQETVEDWKGRKGSVSVLTLAAVEHSSRYVLLATTCNSSGGEIFRLLDGDDRYRICLRHSNRAIAAFADGSVRALNKSQLFGLGFEAAFDEAVPPNTISLTSDNP